MLSRLSAISGIAARQYTSQNSLLLRAGTLSAYKSPFHTSPHNMVMDKIVYTAQHGNGQDHLYAC